ncbi:MAG: AAA family ATPase [Anaerorhabdus sp.]
MRISNVKIKNYRNLRDVDVDLTNIVGIIGPNNGGKSNFIKAITLPFLSDETGFVKKNLSWLDINGAAKNSYYNYIIENFSDIRSGQIDKTEFISMLPIVSVQITLEAKELEEYFVRHLSYAICDDKIKYGIKYEFAPKNGNEILNNIREIFSTMELKDLSIDKMKMNLLPTNLYEYRIIVPLRESSVGYDTLKYFKCSSLIAERDDFSRTNDKMGSNALVSILQNKLDVKSKLEIEIEYSNFFQKLKNLSDMNDIINWQEKTELKNATDFFNEINIVPNMPSMYSLLNSVRLGYSGETLSLQGLGYRNLVLLFVLINSLLINKNEASLSILTIEEPEAHLCINNERLLVSYIKNFVSDNDTVQLLYTSHSTDFINKFGLDNILIFNNGNGISLKTELDEKQRNYLAKIPNLDLFKLFFSKKCILVEGVTEELLIRSYLDSEKNINEIQVISFHKGYIAILDIWLKINKENSNKIGIIRDYDMEQKAKDEHEEYNSYKNVCVQTTKTRTLETEIVDTETNYEILKKYFEGKYSWNVSDKLELSQKWCNSKASVMLELCRDLQNGEISGFTLPRHIAQVLHFLTKSDDEDMKEEKECNEN